MPPPTRDATYKMQKNLDVDRNMDFQAFGRDQITLKISGNTTRFTAGSLLPKTFKPALRLLRF